jgi:hypothetical protein
MRIRDRDEKIRQLGSSIEDAAQWATLVPRIKMRLTSMLDTWTLFQKDGAKYFKDESMPLENAFGSRDSFGALEAAYAELEMLLKQLDGSISTLNDNLTCVCTR